MKGTDLEHEDFKDQWNPNWLPPFRKTYTDSATGESRPLVLKEHQMLAVTFMKHCQERFGFCLIGDEMGLGKVKA